VVFSLIHSLRYDDVFIDAGLDDVASLVSEFSVNTEVYVLDAGQDAIAQITQVLGGDRTSVP
jgi:Domain of unknown function (DUF4347)